MEIAMTSIVTARLSLPAVAAILSLFTFSQAATAQEQLAPAVMYPGMAGRGQMTCEMDQYVDGELAFLKTELKITEAQTQQWNVFAQAFSADREKRASLRRDAMEQTKEVRSVSLLDTISMAEEQLAQRLDSLRAMKAALQPLYASLGKEQRKTADRIMRGGQVF
jgi:LTXXQ motif family protein